MTHLIYGNIWGRVSNFKYGRYGDYNIHNACDPFFFNLNFDYSPHDFVEFNYDLFSDIFSHGKISINTLQSKMYHEDFTFKFFNDI